VIVLRKARLADCERVYRWNFAPDVRAMSKSAANVSLADHTRWYANRIKSESPIWIITEEALPLGVVRIDDNGRISIALDPLARGRGVGKRAIFSACQLWLAPLLAEVLVSNVASRKCFEACGFVAIAQANEVITYHWSP
jgi:RimJ/RimL family protein N-acetyltransferase